MLAYARLIGVDLKRQIDRRRALLVVNEHLHRSELELVWYAASLTSDLVAHRLTVAGIDPTYHGRQSWFVAGLAGQSALRLKELHRDLVRRQAAAPVWSMGRIWVLVLPAVLSALMALQGWLPRTLSPQPLSSPSR